MLLKNEVLDRIISGEISVVFRFWKRPTVKAGGTLKTQKGVLSIERVERLAAPGDVADADLKHAGLKSRDELPEITGGGDLFKITVSYLGEDPRIAMRENLDPAQLEVVLRKLEKTGGWVKEFLQLIRDQPSTHAQTLADQIGLEKPKFKAKVRRLKALGLTESLSPGYKLSPRGREILKRL